MGKVNLAFGARVERAVSRGGQVMEHFFCISPASPRDLALSFFQGLNRIAIKSDQDSYSLQAQVDIVNHPKLASVLTTQTLQVQFCPLALLEHT